ncbi:3D domain-containing protein [Carnobacterium maltaromaticum]|uniref:3D domain-containing protein n=1 Tax=Carnobacterium maltaromaticum TaxID=2751 RepID=UPI00295EA586|nr:3D domain-containing protein [Carnobacterium maltaromaticum]
MKKRILSIAIASTLFVGIAGVSSALAATLDDNSEQVVPKNVATLSGQTVLANLTTQKNSNNDSKTIVQELLAAQTLKDQTPSMSKVTKVEKTPTVANYTVEAGDTIENIAKAFEVSLADLMKWNAGLTIDSIIQVGQTIKIQTEKDPTTIETSKLSWEAPAPVVEVAPEPAVVAEAPVTQPVEAVAEVAPAPTVETTPTAAAPSGRVVTVSATAYSTSEPGMSSFTALGIDLRQTSNVIAVDPNVIPLGSRVFVEGYGEAIAGDTGGAIVGNKIDVHFATVDACYQWGVRSVQVTILD